MAEFAQAFSFMIHNEGGFSDNPNDAGGATNFGISLRYMRSLPDDTLRKYGVHVPPDAAAIRDMTPEQARAIYEGEFWSGALEEIPKQPFANYVFDMCVNHGPADGIRILQRAICSAARNQHEVKTDGVLGQKTLDAMARNYVFLPATLIATRAQCFREYAEQRGQHEFLPGWLDRAFRFG